MGDFRKEFKRKVVEANYEQHLGGKPVITYEQHLEGEPVITMKVVTRALKNKGMLIKNKEERISLFYDNVSTVTTFWEPKGATDDDQSDDTIKKLLKIL